MVGGGSSAVGGTGAVGLLGPGTTLRVQTSSLPGCNQGANYNQPLQATGGTLPYTWSISVGSLPTGLNLVGSNITGNCNGSTTTFTAKVTDAVAATATQSLTITVNPAALAISPAGPGTLQLATCTQNQPCNASYTLSGGTPPYTCSTTPSPIAAGFNVVALINNNICQITGTPSASGTVTFTGKGTDTVPTTVQQSYSIVVNPSTGTIAGTDDFYAPFVSAGTWPQTNCQWLSTDGPANAPKICLNTSVANTPSVSNNPVSVSTSSGLASAVSNAACGDVISVAVVASDTNQSCAADVALAHPGAYCVHLTPAKACAASNWITVQSAGAIPAEGTRIDPGYGGYTTWPPSEANYDPVNLSYPELAAFGTTPIRTIPYITSDRNTGSDLSIRGSGVVDIQNGASDWRFIGLELTRDVWAAGPIVNAPQGSPQASNIIFDRDFIHGRPQSEVGSGFAVGESNNIALIDSYVVESGCLANPGLCTDSQAVSGGNGNLEKRGIKWVNNFLSSAAECWEMGGGTALLVGFDPTDNLPLNTLRDGEVRRNHCYKPPVWLTAGDLGIGPQNAQVAPGSTILLTASFWNLSSNTPFTLSTSPSLVACSSTTTTNCAVICTGAGTPTAACTGAAKFQNSRMDSEIPIVFNATSTGSYTVTINCNKAGFVCSNSTTVQVNSVHQAHVVTVIPSDLTVNMAGNPSENGLRLGSKQQFWALVDGSCGTLQNGYGTGERCPNSTEGGPTSPIVSWSVCDNNDANCSPGGNSTLGTIDAGGMYSSPSQAPPGNKVFIRAIANVDGTSFDVAAVTLSQTAAYVHVTRNPYDVKNNMEWKQGIRFLVEANLIEYSFLGGPSDEQGYQTLILPKNQSGACSNFGLSGCPIDAPSTGLVATLASGTIWNVTVTCSSVNGLQNCNGPGNTAVGDNVNICPAGANTFHTCAGQSGSPGPAQQFTGVYFVTAILSGSSSPFIFQYQCTVGSDAGMPPCGLDANGHNFSNGAGTTSGGGNAVMSNAPAATDDDFIVRYNVYHHSASMFSVGAGNSSNGGPPFDVGRISFHDNIGDDLNSNTWDVHNAGTQGFFVEIAGLGNQPAHDISIIHNDAFPSTNPFSIGALGGVCGQQINVTVENNIIGGIGMSGGPLIITPAAPGCPAQSANIQTQINGYFSPGMSTWDHNVIVGGTSGTNGWQPVGITNFVPTQWAITSDLDQTSLNLTNWLNGNGGNYILCSVANPCPGGIRSFFSAGQGGQATDGKDNGAAVSVINQYQNGVQ